SRPGRRDRSIAVRHSASRSGAAHRDAAAGQPADRFTNLRIMGCAALDAWSGGMRRRRSKVKVMKQAVARFHSVAIGALLALGSVSPVQAAPGEERSLDELRNTVVNLLQALVEKGVVSREQAELMVKQAQDKASVDAAAAAKVEAEEAGAVRVTHV